MGLPDGQWTFCFELPVCDPAVGVASKEAGVVVHKAEAVYVGSVASQDVAGVRGGKGLGLAVQGHWPGGGWLIE
jgi:hypothetical protein